MHVLYLVGLYCFIVFALLYFALLYLSTLNQGRLYSMCIIVIFYMDYFASTTIVL